MSAISRIVLLQKLDGMSTDDFRRYWRSVHGPLAARIPGLLRYEQNAVVDNRQLGIDHPRSEWSVDGFAELVFADQASMDSALRSEEYAVADADGAKFIGRADILLCEKHVVISPPGAGVPSTKRMSIINGKASITAEQYRHEWLVVHAEKVPHLPAIQGYAQNLVLSQDPAPSSPARKIDGIVELWFPTPEAIVRAFSSPASEVTQGHAKTFLEMITTFLVDPHRVV